MEAIDPIDVVRVCRKFGILPDLKPLLRREINDLFVFQDEENAMFAPFAR